MSNRFILNETSYHGAGAVNDIAVEVQARGFQKAFVCSDPDLVKFGVTQKVLDVLESNDLPYELYSDIKPNPTIENVQTGVAAYRSSGADYIIAIGGGSSMDTAKAVGIKMCIRDSYHILPGGSSLGERVTLWYRTVLKQETFVGTSIICGGFYCPAVYLLIVLNK